jgi:HSP20 family molecular chaperone IbpA
MVRRIKPVTRARKAETRVRRLGAEPLAREREVLRIFETWGPSLDVGGTKDEIVVETELAGVAREDVEVILCGNRLEIRGIKRETALPAGARFLRLERAYGNFRRIVVLPAAVVPERARACLENGILTVRLKRRGPGEPRRKPRGPGRDK